MACHMLMTPFWLLLLSATTFATFCPGDNWTPYSDRCVKVVENITTYAEAKLICSQDFLPSDVEEPMVIEIKTEEEQIFMTNFLFNISQIPLGVWLGANRKSNSSHAFQWSSDSASLNFNNWAVDNPSDNAARGCIEMISDLTRSTAGDWRDVTCEKGNWVVCQKTAALSVPEMSLGLVQLKRWKDKHIQEVDSSDEEVEDYFKILKDSISALQTDLSSLKASHINLQVKHTTDYNSLNVKLTSLQTSHNSLSNNHSTLQTSHNTLRTEHNSLNSKHTSLQTSHNLLSNNHSTLQTNFNSLQTSHNTLRTDFNSLNSKHTSLQTSHTTLSTKVTGLESSQTSLGKTIIPIGFIFTQLPSQSEPKTLWPQFTWSDVSSTYAGRFFRVVGGNAAGFGIGQSDAFQTHQHGGAYTSVTWRGSDLNSNYPYTFAWNLHGGDTYSISTGSRTASETRPVNYSVKIWRRTA